MYESPRDRRLKSDLQALQRLKVQSSILDFECLDSPPTRYIVSFRGKGLMQPPNSDSVAVQEYHQVEIRLGVNYPRSKPDLKWKSPMFHPNISALGQVCLGGYSTHWVPSLNLDELCEMLWDMVRYANYDVKSPYNYKAARWVERQQIYRFPMDSRSLRDKVQAGLVEPADLGPAANPAKPPPPAGAAAAPKPPDEDVIFIDASTPAREEEEEKKPEDVVYIGDE
jgi:ubiquitin-protein ligase